MKTFIPINNSIKFKIKDLFIYVYGPLGINRVIILSGISVKIFSNTLYISEVNKNKFTKSNFSLFIALLKNAIYGVKKFFSKTLKISGSGYKFSIFQNTIFLFAGQTKKIFFIIPTNLTITLLDSTRIVISGLIKEVVGEFSAKIRNVSPVEPYKLRGISYLDEIILKKEGKKRK